MFEGSNLEGLLKIFTFNKKKELERHCRSLVVSGSDFVSLILSCEERAEPFIHQISYRDIVPRHLEPSESELKALADNGLGELGPEAAKAVRKMGQMFEDRRYLVGHIFFSPNLSEWHFFCFDQRDLEDQRPNHWKEGPHVHFINWLWPGQEAKSVWSNFVGEYQRPGNAIHLRFSMDYGAARRINQKG
jgi:hypothetical protein